MKTAFDRIKSMSKDELAELILTIYKWGHINEQCDYSSEYLYAHLLDIPSHMIDGVVASYHNLTLHTVKAYPTNGGEPYFMPHKYFSLQDAQDSLVRFEKACKVTNDTYANEQFVYVISAECSKEETEK